MTSDEQNMRQATSAYTAAAAGKTSRILDTRPKILISSYLFIIHLISGYQYRHADVRPWDPLNDMYQYERDYIICTKTKHKTPMIRTQSIVSVSEAAKKAASMAAASKEHRHRHRVVNQQPSSSKVEKVKA